MPPRILQVNVRLSEGGAAQIALALHKELPKHGFDSHFAYGYSKGAKRHLAEPENCIQLTSRTEALYHFIENRLTGGDILPLKLKSLERFALATAHADVVHLHCIHSYYLNQWGTLDFLASLGKPIIWTLHDHWAITGRCAFLDGCENWTSGCGNCSTKSNYPPTQFDCSARAARKKRELINNLVIRGRINFVSPSNHLAKDFLRIFPEAKIDIIPNSVSADFSTLANLSTLKGERTDHPIKISVVAHDLSYAGKTNHKLINSLIGTENIEIVTIGKNSPFLGKNVTNLGELTTRKSMLDALLSADCTLFTSSVDNFPLAICESLYAGVPVIATSSPASDEVLAYVDLKTYPENKILQMALDGTLRAELDAINATNFHQKARAEFSPSEFINRHIRVYERAFKCH